MITDNSTDKDIYIAMCIVYTICVYTVQNVYTYIVHHIHNSDWCKI